MKNTARTAGLLGILLLATSCHIRGGEPSNDDLFGAVKDQLEHANDRGGIKINMGNAGAFQNITFKLKLHTLSKHSCTGGNYAYTCKVSMMVSYPPVKKTPEMLDGEVMVFDGPGGWRVIE
ncbi:MAG: hypothetical protein ABI644_02985 [Arenimonas sp.]